MNENTLVLFFTRNVSLEDWISSGLIDREKVIYEEFLKNKIFKKIYWITYGSKDLELAKDLYSKNKLDRRIIILEKNKFFKGKFLNYIYSFYLIFKFKKYFNETSILKTNQIDGAWSALIAKYLFNKPLFLRCGYLISKSSRKWKTKSVFKIFLIEMLEKIAFNYCSASTVTSLGDRSYLKEKLKLKKLPKVNPSFIDTNKFKDDDSSLQKRELLFIGRFSEEKNLFNIADAAKKNSLILNLIGNGKLKEELARFADRHEIKINFLGNFQNNDLPRIINQYKYFIICSESEGLPKSLLEAMSSGRICIGSDVPGINNLISHKINGFLSKSTNKEDINDAISIALESDKEIEIKRNARNFIFSNFSLKKFTNLEQEIIREISK